MRKKISVSTEHQKTLSEEFGITTQSVRMMLQYVFNSDKAKSVRSRAKELLLEEAESIKEDEIIKK